MPLDKNFAIGNFIGGAINDKLVFITNANNTPRRSYLYMADLAIWLWTILFKGNPEIAYNVGGETEYSIREVGEMVSTIADVPIHYSLGWKHQHDDYIPYVKHTMDTLGLQEWIPLNDAISRTLEFYAKR
jgi:nucleoside-diphosphate-sugar epimerase